MPIKRLHIAALCLTLLLLASGCRSRRDTAQPAPPGQAVPERQGKVAEPEPAKPTYRTAAFTCTLQGTQASGQIRTIPDSLIWASASKIIELGRAELTPDSVRVYSRVINRCFRGSYDDIYRRFHYRTSFQEIQSLLTASDADRQIAALLKQLHIGATVHIDLWKETTTLTFPFSIPPNARPL